MGAKTDQRSARAGRDLVGRDKVENHFHGGALSAKALADLKGKLKSEIDGKNSIDHVIEELACYYEKFAHDGIDGLEAKLKAAGRTEEMNYALMQKERFAKLLDKWRHYASAQEIFLILLAEVHTTFEIAIRPLITKEDQGKINELTLKKIVEPILSEMNGEVLPSHSIGSARNSAR
jgi:hypothetical protein